MKATHNGTLTPGRFEVTNYCRVEAFSYNLFRKHLILRGPNACGKSSILDAFWQVLERNAAKKSEPVRRGAHEARISLDLHDEAGKLVFKVTREYKDGGTELTVCGADGEVCRHPRELLDKFLNSYCFNLSLFINAKPKDQVRELLRACKVTIPLEEIAAITGEPFAPRDEESAFEFIDRLAGKDQVFWERRHKQGQTMRQKEAALAEARKALCEHEPVDETVPSGSLPELLQRIEELQEDGVRRRESLSSAAAMRRRYEGGVQKLIGLRKESAGKEADIAELEARIAKLRKEKTAIDEQATSVEVELGTYVKTVEKAEADAAALPDPAAELATLRDQVKAFETVREVRLKRQQAEALVERLAQEAYAELTEHGRLELILQRLGELPRKILESHDLGVPGLEIRDSEIRLNGIPLSQASFAQKIQVALRVATKSGAQLKAIRMDDAEHLDSENMEAFIAAAEAEGFTCLLGLVASDLKELTVELREKAEMEVAECTT